MPVPDFQSLMLPLLKTLNDGREHSIKESQDLLSTEFKLTTQDKEEMLPSGRTTTFSNRVAWAKAHLKMATLIESTKRGHFQITASGKDLLNKNPTVINLKILKEIPGYLENACGNKDEDKIKDIVSFVESIETPEVIIDQNYLKLRNANISYEVGSIGKSVKNLNVFVGGSNLFVITKFSGSDPEVNVDKNNNGYPSRNIEYLAYPTPRLITFGFNMSL